MSGTHSFGVKEQIDYPTLVFRQIDRVMLILSEQYVNHEQLARAVDGLNAISWFLEEAEKGSKVKKIKVPDKKLTTTEYYTHTLKFLRDVMGRLDGRRLLVKKTATGYIGKKNSFG